MGSTGQDRQLEALDVLFTIAPLLADQMHSTLSARGLSVSKAALLWRVTTTGAQTQRALSEFLRVTPRAVTGFVDDLVAAGLARRAPHPGDRRAVLVTASAAGRRKVSTMQRQRRAFAEYLLAETTDADLRAFTRTGAAIMARLRELVG